jgi:acetolactate synthase I/II/III large subunit
LDQVLDDYLLRGLNVACLVGNRMNNPLDAALLLRLAEKYRLPVATTLSGKGAFPEGHELALGLYVLPAIPGRWKPSMAMKWMCCWCWVAI